MMGESEREDQNFGNIIRVKHAMMKEMIDEMMI